MGKVKKRISRIPKGSHPGQTTRVEGLYNKQRGNEILVKMVITVIPIYAMSIFKLPKAQCDEINSSLARFW